jgi:hypothetical protein
MGQASQCGRQTWGLSAPEMIDQPEEEREAQAEEEASDNWEIEGSVLTSVNDITRKTAEAKWYFAPKIEKSADERQESTQEEEGTAKFAKGVHKLSVEEEINEAKKVLRPYKRVWLGAS